MANLISQFDLNDNGASEAATPHPRHSSPPWQSSCLLTPGHRTTRPPNHLATEPPRDLTSRPLHLTTSPPVVLLLTYTCSLAVDFDEFCELMTRPVGGGPVVAVREAARQALAAPSAPTTHQANQARHPTN